MGEHIEHLAKKLDSEAVGLARVWIPAYPNPDPNASDPIVNAHWRDTDDLYKVDPREREAMEEVILGPELPPPPETEEEREEKERRRREAKPERYPYVSTGYGPSRREARNSVVVKTLPRAMFWGVRKMTIDGFVKNGYVPTNITRTTTGKTIISFVRPD